MAINNELDFKIANLPDSPGCYLMKNKGQIIYVGKAKNLKNRVRQYFNSPKGHSVKVLAMVEKIDDFDIVLVDSEFEALILECNLIKLHQPWYNILLKDGKQYPFVRIDLNDPFPKVEVVRKAEKDGAKYFGPYIGASIIRDVLEAAHQIFLIRTCNRVINPLKPQRPCIQHQIGRCLGPCAGSCTSAQYHGIIKQVINFLNGKYDDIIEELTKKMNSAAKDMNYERAANFRDKIQAVVSIMEKQKAITKGGVDQDVLACATDGIDALVQMMYIRDGKLIGSEHFIMERAGDEATGTVLPYFVMQFYTDSQLVPKEIILEDAMGDEEALSKFLSEKRGNKVAVTIPQRGEKKALLAMAQKNARDACDKRSSRLMKSKERTIGALEELQEVLGLTVLPRRIEGFDNSNIQGTDPVASMVVAIDGVAAPKEYRRFKIKTVIGANDFASMNEVLSRRFRHGLEEQKELVTAGKPIESGKFSNLPDLILIDGGSIQLAFAQEAMFTHGLNIPMFGLAKRIDEIYLPGREEPIYLDRHSKALHLIQRLRDEAHRFAVTFHKQLRNKNTIKSRLEEIKGIGPSRRKSLLKHFQTVEKLKSASLEELQAAPGMTIIAAQSVYDFFRQI